jgi:hypothetical protein
MPKNKRGTLKRKCDAIWSQIIRSKGYCEKCGGTHYLQAHHISSRNHLILRYELLNGVCLCGKCHIPIAHNKPATFMEWFKSHNPEAHKFILKMEKHLAVGKLKPDLEEIYKNLLEESENL